ncbi:MAG: flavodoxin-dependent (E)-4-hydroxy-3-methylbut-2-enyl-diphosphate synthase, partial [Candidatus Aminicenantes bacterium]|nr:flavodoxin-dependent (E)-4-hydroxy-3-methylbut-2-enyl-diphosphate synthase [Candidatus Aminicenantes bacterium]
MFPRRRTRRVGVGGVPVGGGAPVAVQAMTKTDTRAAAAGRVPIRIGVNSGSLEKDILA